MDPNTKVTDLQAQLKERLEKLPAVVRDAITSADVQKRMRELANTHNLHVDQWEALENQVLMTLLGLEEPENLEKNLEKEVGLARDIALPLAVDINRIVFQPIRDELQRELGSPQAKEEEHSDIEDVRTQMLAEAHHEAPVPVASQSVTPAAPPVSPATPPAPPPTERAVRAPVSSAYSAQQPSTERKNVHDDPYREAPL